MKATIPLSFALTLALVAPTVAQEMPTGQLHPFTAGDTVVVVGEVSSPPRDFLVTHEKKMQVAIGPDRLDHTFHFRDAIELRAMDGSEMVAENFHRGMWVRAEGRIMEDDHRRIQVDRLQVLGTNLEEYQRSAHFNPQWRQGYAMTAAGERYSTTAPIPPGTQVAILGEIISPPADFLVTQEQKMQVQVGPEQTSYTIHFADAQLVGLAGEDFPVEHFHRDMWVRAIGTAREDDPRRIDADRVEVIAKDRTAFQQSPFYAAGLGTGYVMTASGERQIFGTALDRPYVVAEVPAPVTGPVTIHQPMPFTSPAPLTMVGRIEGRPSDRELRVNTVGEMWHARTSDQAEWYDAAGRRIAWRDAQPGHWVRLTGWQTGDRQMRVSRVDHLGTDQAFRTSPYYRADAPMGYVERVAGARAEFQPVTFRGTVVSAHPEWGYFVMRDEAGQQRRVYADAAQIMLNGRSIALNALRTGDWVTVQGRLIQF
jgi:hypothetical protein